MENTETSTEFSIDTRTLSQKLDEVYKECNYDDWDDDGAYGISSTVYSYAKSFLPFIDSIYVVRVKPYETGTLGFEWLVHNKSIKLVFGDTPLFFYYIKDGDKEESEVLPYTEANKLLVIDKIEQASKLRTNIVGLDENIGGGLPIGTTLISTQCGMGKTSFMTTLAGGLLKDNNSIMYISTEENCGNILDRLACAVSLKDCIGTGTVVDYTAGYGNIVESLIKFIEKHTENTKVDVLMIDSISTLFSFNDRARNIVPVKQWLQKLSRYCSTRGIILIASVQARRSLIGSYEGVTPSRALLCNLYLEGTSTVEDRINGKFNISVPMRKDIEDFTIDINYKVK